MALTRTLPGMGTLSGSTGIVGRAAEGGESMHGGQRARWTLGDMWGRSSAMERLFLQMRYLANHLRLASIEGERGSGKRLVARTLHGLGANRGKGFVPCAAAEFFGENVFAARLAEARGGTLYLSGVDALNPEQQGRLVHLLGWMEQQNGRAFGALRPVALGQTGAGEGESTAPRALLVSSERPLRALVLRGKFRNDLYQQLSAVHLLVPPLRDRREDVALLLERFAARFAREYGKGIRGVMGDVLPPLLAYGWPGNVRELQTAIERAVVRSEGEWLRRKDVVLSGSLDGYLSGSLSGSDLPEAAGAARGAHPIDRQRPPALESAVWLARPGESAQLHGGVRDRMAGDERGTHGRMENAAGRVPRAYESAGLVAACDRDRSTDLDPNLDRAILRHIRRVLESVGGNKLRAARLLGISRSTLYRLLDADAGARFPQHGPGDEHPGLQTAMAR